MSNMRKKQPENKDTICSHMDCTRVIIVEIHQRTALYRFLQDIAQSIVRRFHYGVNLAGRSLMENTLLPEDRFIKIGHPMCPGISRKVLGSSSKLRSGIRQDQFYFADGG